MLRTERVLQLRGQQGRSVRVVREHYLRPDVPCRSALCRAACPRGEGAEGGRLGVGAPGRRGSGTRAARAGIARAGAVGGFSPGAVVPQRTSGRSCDPWAEVIPHGLDGPGLPGRGGLTGAGGTWRERCGGAASGAAVTKRERTVGERWGGGGAGGSAQSSPAPSRAGMARPGQQDSREKSERSRVRGYCKSAPSEQNRPEMNEALRKEKKGLRS